jgi:hypothetical protein
VHARLRFFFPGGVDVGELGAFLARVSPPERLFLLVVILGRPARALLVEVRNVRRLADAEIHSASSDEVLETFDAASARQLDDHHFEHRDLAHELLQLRQVGRGACAASSAWAAGRVASTFAS